MIYRLIFGLAAGLCILSGCLQTNPANLQSPTDIESMLLYQSKDDIIAKLGAPEGMLRVTSASESWTYTSYTAGLTGGVCKLTVSFTNDKVSSVIVNAGDRSWVTAPMGSCAALLSRL